MVLKTELCHFSGAKIYPGKGIRICPIRFPGSSTRRTFKLKLSRKGYVPTTKKPYSRSIVGATLEVIQKRRMEKAEVRDAAREAALREIKERIKKTKDEKRAKKPELMAKTQKTAQTKVAYQRLQRAQSLVVVVGSDERHLFRTCKIALDCLLDTGECGLCGSLNYRLLHHSDVSSCLLDVLVFFTVAQHTELISVLGFRIYDLGFLDLVECCIVLIDYLTNFIFLKINDEVGI